jgi:hypothetical protein
MRRSSIRLVLRSSGLVLFLALAVGGGCTCAGMRMGWLRPPEEMAAFGAPADAASRGQTETVAWVLEWNGEQRTPSERGRTTLVCRFHRMTEKARPKLLDLRFLVPLVLAPDELLPTDETVVVHTDIGLENFQWARERRGPLGLWFLRVERSEDGVLYWANTLPCEVRTSAR